MKMKDLAARFKTATDLDTNSLSPKATLALLEVSRQRIYALAQNGTILKTRTGFYAPSVRYYRAVRDAIRASRWGNR